MMNIKTFSENTKHSSNQSNDAPQNANDSKQHLNNDGNDNKQTKMTLLYVFNRLKKL